jgi:cytochrome c oxidase cbb3-type subunit 3
VSYHPCTIRPSIRTARRLIGVFTLILLSAAGCEPPGKPDAADKPVTPDQIVDFEQLFSANCAGCHGATGKFGPAPPLNDSLFAAIIPDEELLRVIRDGRTGTPMPAFSRASGGSLTDVQVKSLADGVKSHWKSKAPLSEAPPAYAITKATQSIPPSEGHARRMDIYQRACAGCHGPNGAGGEGNHARVGAINVPAFLALISDQALRRIIITGRPDLGMPTYAENRGRPADYRPLASAEIDDLVALLAEWRSTGNVALIEGH